MTRIYYFPRPYPDELIGSLILRACLHRGISIGRMAELFTGHRNNLPLGMSSILGKLAAANGLDAEMLLWENTVFPYVTAFMSEAETARLAHSLFGIHSVGNAALTQAATQGTLGQRFCTQCLLEDKTQFGEAYWHREHNLPFVLICRKHNLLLLEIEQPAGQPYRGTSTAWCLPENHLGTTNPEIIPRYMTQAITVLSTSLLTSRNRKEPAEWHREYRTLASTNGLMPYGSGLASKAFADSFKNFFGQSFLEAARLDFPPNRDPWPALMLREGQNIPYITPKHVLLQIFLQHAELPKAGSRYQRPGLVARDYAALDASFYQMVRNAIRAAQPQNMRVEITHMLTELGIWGVFRHYRNKLPQTRALISEFRQTKFSARQIGRRPRKKPKNKFNK